MEEINAFWQGAIEFFKQPLVICGTTITLGGLIALIIRMVFTIPKNKDIIAIKGDMREIKEERNNYVSIAQYNALVTHCERQGEFMLDLAQNIKNQTTREEYVKKAHELIETTPHEIIVEVKAKPIEKKARF